MLRVHNLTKIYKGGFFSPTSLEAVKEACFEIPKGQCFGIIGESGSGKTTIGKMVTGLLVPTSGTVEIDGINIFEKRFYKKLDFHKHIQMIFQEPDGVFDPRWRIEKSMMEPYRLHTNLSTKEIKKEISGWIETVGLSQEHLTRYPFELSGGQLQRLAFARAMSLRPDLIVADEPTSSLDVSVQAQILTMMKDLQKQYNQTILFITHDLYVARQVCERVAVMQQGRLIEQGSAEQVFRFPQHDYTREILAAQLPPDLTSRDKVNMEEYV